MFDNGATKEQDDVDFCTLGMFIIDEIHFEGSRPPVYGIIGGAGSFAVVGARMVAGKQYGKAVSWIVDVGSDFPAEVLDTIQSWDTGCVIREDKSRLTTRAWNGYGANEKRDFKYLTPKLRLEPSMLSQAQLFSKTFHMEAHGTPVQSVTKPIFIWEPVPDRCTPEDQGKFLAACRMVNMVSPNELELGMMFGRPGWNETDPEDRRLVQNILQSGIGFDNQGTLVIRAGKDGSYAYSLGRKGIWLPAYHETRADQTSKVIDPTGAGNSFLGALAQGMISEGRQGHQLLDVTLAASSLWDRIKTRWGNEGQVPKALICATVAAGFVVEQIGVPTVSTAEGGRETWNGTEFTERLRIYTQRLCKTLEQFPPDHDWLED
ncbi:putative protein C16C9,01c [Talaromyces islandicus]|uniref:Carbohydrate kinase PfkB domain-containing protein n=1 Tax=Talaromyces islandicus TaxID=28573 RepID=A0A0U1M2F5_TALIS|nr:putative protein C16C9,01c [Talaromyces islandicus]